MIAARIFDKFGVRNLRRQVTASFGGNQRPNIIGDPHISNPSIYKWFNTTAFAQPPAFTFGGAPRAMDLSLIYKALADGQVDVIAGDATSAQIDALDLVKRQAQEQLAKLEALRNHQMVVYSNAHRNHDRNQRLGK